MYTRMREITSKSRKARDLCNTIENQVLPILKKQTGFVDDTVLVSDAEQNRFVARRNVIRPEHLDSFAYQA